MDSRGSQPDLHRIARGSGDMGRSQQYDVQGDLLGLFRRVERAVNRVVVYGIQGEFFAFQVVSGDFHGVISSDRKE